MANSQPIQQGQPFDSSSAMAAPNARRQNAARIAVSRDPLKPSFETMMASMAGFQLGKTDRNTLKERRRQMMEEQKKILDSFSGNGPAPPKNEAAHRDQKVPPGPNDIFIAVMGVTGAGKSSFIKHCCGTGEKIVVGHNLEACTSVVGVHKCDIAANSKVWLIDTPGFDDTHRNDTEVLREIAAWLTDSYCNEVRLRGIIYLHRITDVRMQGSAKRNLLMFKKLCGPDALKNVVLATSMWDKIATEEGSQREQQLTDTPEFWGWMKQRGSVVLRHSNTKSSAMAIVERFLDKGKVTLDIQQQMAVDGKSLNETTAGQELYKEFEKERAEFRQQIAEAQEEIKIALARKDQESLEVMEEIKAEAKSKMARMELSAAELKISMEQLHKDKFEEMQKQMKKQREQFQKEIDAMKAREDRLLKEQEFLRDKQRSSTPSGASPSTDSPPSYSPLAPTYSASNDKTLLTYGSYDHPQVSFALCRGSAVLICTSGSTKYFEDEKLQTMMVGYAFRCFAFGQGGSWAGSVYAIPSDKNFTTGLRYSSGFEYSYPDLAAKLQNPANGAVLRLWLGPAGTYVCIMQNVAGHNLPPHIPWRNKYEDIKFMSLGCCGTYVIAYRDGSMDWNLGTCYPRLSSELYTLRLAYGAISKIKCITLDQSWPGQFLMAMEDGRSWSWVGTHVASVWSQYLTLRLGFQSPTSNVPYWARSYLYPWASSYYY